MKKVAAIFASVIATILSMQISCAQPVAPTPSPVIEPPPIFAGIKSATSAAPIGLTLSLELNSTEFRPGEEVSIAVKEKNVLTNINTIQAAQSWPLSNLGLGP